MKKLPLTNKNWVTHPTNKNLIISAIILVASNGLLVLSTTDLFTESFFNIKYILIYPMMVMSTVQLFKILSNYFRVKWTDVNASKTIFTQRQRIFLFDNWKKYWGLASVTIGEWLTNKIFICCRTACKTTNVKNPSPQSKKLLLFTLAGSKSNSAWWCRLGSG